MKFLLTAISLILTGFLSAATARAGAADPVRASQLSHQADAEAFAPEWRLVAILGGQFFKPESVVGLHHCQTSADWLRVKMWPQTVEVACVNVRTGELHSNP